MSRSHHGTLSRRRVDGQLTWLLIENIDLHTFTVVQVIIIIIIIIVVMYVVLVLVVCVRVCIVFGIFCISYIIVMTTVAAAAIIEAPNIIWKKLLHLYNNIMTWAYIRLSTLVYPCAITRGGSKVQALRPCPWNVKLTLPGSTGNVLALAP